MAGRHVESPDGFRAAGTLAAATNSAVSQMLADATTGLPLASGFQRAEYDRRLRLESITQPYLGASTGNTFGGALRASFGMSFGDMLKDRQLHSLFRVGTDVDDLAAQIAYVNRRHRLNWGVTAGFMPSRFFGARRSVARDGALVTRETTSLRYTHQWATLNGRYGLNRSQRVEFGAGVRRTGFEWQRFRRVLDAEAQEELSREARELPAGRPIHLTEAHVAFVHDTAIFGATSPILGQRYRFEIEPAFGAVTFADVRLDYRRYFMPLRPFTIAARIEHVGRYGSGAADPRLTPLVNGLQTLVRGYDLRAFAAEECGIGASTCSMMDELTGSRFALLNLEVRAPLAGILSRSLEYGRLPVEALAFIDAGFLWTAAPAGTARRGLEFDRFRSIGAGARVNVGGIIFELTAARPLDRRGSGWRSSILLRPGF
jgi:hypothetical protein